MESNSDICALRRDGQAAAQANLYDGEHRQQRKLLGYA